MPNLGEGGWIEYTPQGNYNQTNEGQRLEDQQRSDFHTILNHNISHGGGE
jgi:hypothetical protein